MTDNNALAMELELLARNADQTDSDIRYYSGGSTVNASADALAKKCRDNLPAILSALRAQPAPVAGEVGELVERLRNISKHGDLGPLGMKRLREYVEKAADMLERLAGPVQQTSGDQVEREIRDAISLLDNVTATDSTADDLGCAELALHRALEALAAMQTTTSAEQWLPIESAPMDVLCMLFEPHDEGGFCFVGCTNMDGEWVNNLDMKVQYPTLWKPLDPPSLDGEG